VGVVGTLLLAAAAGLATGGAGRKFIPAVAAGPRQVPLPGAPPAHGGQPMTTLALGAAELRVPRGYFGLSTEYWALPLFERHMGSFERILKMLHWPGDEPLMLRIGGDSADHSLFDANVGRLPNALFELTPGWFARASALVRDVSARVILDLNLVADLPRMAELWAHAAQNELPAGSIVAYEIGNEPDLYNPLYWSRVFAPLKAALDLRLFTSALTPQTYDRLYLQYARALALFAPQVPLAAPVVAYPTVHFDWLRMFMALPHPDLGLLSAHMYPYSACTVPGSPGYPSVAKLLSEAATTGMAQSLRPAIELAHRAGLPFRLTELNSVTCGGLAGVSDTFATALWAADALFALLRAGVDGINVHVRAYAVNAAFALSAGTVVARPLLYGLITFVRTLGPDAELMQLRVRGRLPAHLKAWAVLLAGDTLHVLLINKGDHSRRVNLLVPRGSGPAMIERLLAPGAAATSGITLAGQHIGADDRWHGRPRIEAALPTGRGYVVSVPPISAALLSVHLTS